MFDLTSIPSAQGRHHPLRCSLCVVLQGAQTMGFRPFHQLQVGRGWARGPERQHRGRGQAEVPHGGVVVVKTGRRCTRAWIPDPPRRSSIISDYSKTTTSLEWLSLLHTRADWTEWPFYTFVKTQSWAWGLVFGVTPVLIKSSQDDSLLHRSIYMLPEYTEILLNYPENFPVYMGHVCGVLERQTSCEQSQAEICGSTDTKQEPVCSNVIVIRTQYVTKRQTKVAQLCIVRLTKRKPYQQLRVDLMYTIQGSICVVQMRYFWTSYIEPCTTRLLSRSKRSVSERTAEQTATISRDLSRYIRCETRLVYLVIAMLRARPCW